jgi:hypothetical protein
MTLVRRVSPQIRFLLLAVLVNLAACALVRGVTDPHRHTLVVFGAALDMTLTVTALYYWLVVRPGLQPKNSLIVIGFMGLLRAAFAFPEVIPGKALLGAGAECALFVAVIVGIYRARNSTFADPAERIRSALAGLIPFPTAARALSGELSILYYAFAWRAKPHAPEGTEPFTLHQKGGFNDLILFVGMASLLEVVPVHLVAAHWSHTAAWILTGLSLYGALWAVALGRSFALRPTLLTDDALLIRFGLLFSLRLPLQEIRAVSRQPLAGATPVPRNSTPSIFLSFRHPLTAEKMLGFTTQMPAIGLSPDDTDAFEKALLAAVPNVDHLPG